MKSAAGLFYLLSKLLSGAITHPDTGASVGNFIVALVIYAIIAAVVGGVAAAIAKLVFEADSKNTSFTFFSVGGVVLGICIICYFIA